VCSDLLGAAAFSLVVSDLKGNVAVRPFHHLRLSSTSHPLFRSQKVRARHASHPTESGTLEELVENEFKTGKKRPASEGLMWLLRGLAFTRLGLQNTLGKDGQAPQELSVGFTNSYEATLKKHHNPFVKAAFSVRHHLRPRRLG
jgi:hypothetical protein